MSSFAWPEPLRSLRGHLPAELRILRGAFGLLGGGFVLVGVLAVLLTSSWQMAYTHDEALTVIFVALLPGALGVLSPLWYWLGRPLWAHFDRPGREVTRRVGGVRFVPGLAGTVVGVWLLFRVSATARFPTLTLGPFGLALVLGSPLWFWVLRPLVVGRVSRLLPDRLRGASPTAIGGRVAVVLVVVFAASAAVTTAMALPVVGVGESVAVGGQSVTVSDTAVVANVSAEDGGYGDEWAFLLVEVTVRNEGATSAQIPGYSYGDITVIAPPCSAQTFGEPSHNCNAVFLDGSEFTANGTTYGSYDARREARGGSLAPGEELSGWLVYRIESRPTGDPDFEPMVIVNEVGRWSLADRWPRTERVTSDSGSEP